MTHHDSITDTDARYVEVLTTRRCGAVFGYRLAGTAAGPRPVVAGLGNPAEQIFDRLLQIPTLPWIRGQLVLIRLDLLDNAPDDLDSVMAIGPVDRTLTLPWYGLEDPSDSELRRGCHHVLRACSRLGMISGRGVPRAALQ
ncbi:hypothetical protein [uncultured Roseobacter sp.]|uniref:hypothetical protein n=1 Tax=uncultured Roseobacter sp. TaxID=114847 RepID=UPI002616AFD1|nr:hypothetical protein [uncultured Roseobacter sp.]